MNDIDHSDSGQPSDTINKPADDMYDEEIYLSIRRNTTFAERMKARTRKLLRYILP